MLIRFRCRRVESSTKLKVPATLIAAAADTAATMSSPTGVNFLPVRLRLEAIAVSAPKPKRVKRIIIPPEPEPTFPIVTNLQELPDVLMAHALAFLVPDAVDPMHKYRGIVVVSEVSKYFRALALGNQVWRRICTARWKTKVGFPTRLANAEAEATINTTTTVKTLIRGGHWYRRFRAEEEDASRTTITRSELCNTTFSIRLWFKSKHQAMVNPNSDPRKVKSVLSSGLDCPSVSDDMRFLPDGSLSGLPELYDGDFYEMNESGSIINFGMSFEDGTHPLASLYVHRRPDWGWELRSNLYAIRSVEHGDIDKLWDDYASCLVVEKRKKGVVVTRSKIKYKRREVPDIPEIKEFLLW